ncbi:iron-sulfur cluster biosynthesis family protein [Secundilactobacillus kimchicus]|nr:iron-sulfur cluster biosynthesis family protein [Secundilactobacillus kimchicus]MBT9671293.1 iron-sulfur cluster biosynthesis family protein [Secundilactobacillus kimchicus]
MARHLTFSQAAIDHVKPYLNDQSKVLLSYDDGVGPYSHHGLVALQISFQLVVINADMPATDYNVEIESNFVPVYVKDYSERMLGQNLTLSEQPKYHTLILADENDRIDENVEVVDERPKG